MRAIVPSIMACAVFAAAALGATDAGLIPLPAPDTTGGMPLMRALNARRSSRRFDPGRPLPDPVLSNLLWAAFGVNRPESGKRTAPSAVNWQEIDILVARADGVYRYDAPGHALVPVLDRDIRALTGRQDFTADAAVDLVYVADYARMQCADDIKDFYSATDTGFIGQNVYLYAASEGLATVTVGLVNRADLGHALGLKATQRITLVQPVGYPRE